MSAGDPTAFITARLDDDERYVRAVKAAAERLKANPDPRMAEFGMSATDAFLDNWDDLAEFTRWKCAVPADLDRQLREVEVKRAILAEHSSSGGMYPTCRRCEHRSSGTWYGDEEGDEEPPDDVSADAWPCKTVRLLAAVWSDHPDYGKLCLHVN
jgi:hypothetical protein